jgi:hypothetical protein
VLRVTHPASQCASGLPDLSPLSPWLVVGLSYCCSVRSICSVRRDISLELTNLRRVSDSVGYEWQRSSQRTEALWNVPTLPWFESATGCHVLLILRVATNISRIRIEMAWQVFVSGQSVGGQGVSAQPRSRRSSRFSGDDTAFFARAALREWHAPAWDRSQRSQEGNQLLLLRGAQVSKALSGVVCLTIVTLDRVVKRQ